MREIIHFIVELVLSLTGALALGSLAVGGIVFALGCALFGCGFWWRGRRRRAAARLTEDQP